MKIGLFFSNLDAFYLKKNFSTAFHIYLCDYLYWCSLIPSCRGKYSLHLFNPACKISLSCVVRDMLEISFFIFFVFWEVSVFISPFLKHSFAGYWILSWFFQALWTYLPTAFCSLLFLRRSQLSLLLRIHYIWWMLFLLHLYRFSLCLLKVWLS